MRKSRRFSASAWCVVLTATIAGCASIGSNRPVAGPADRSITSDVETLLSGHPELGPPGVITVQTFNSIVYLDGQVGGGLEKRIAADVALQAAGVKEVVNDIYVPHS
jgi:osmotically-inducible protein OsmY